MMITDLSPALCCALAGLLFLVTVSVLALLLYKHSISGQWKTCLTEFVLVLFLLPVLSYITAAADTGIIQYQVPIPVAVFFAAILLVLLYTVNGIRKTYRASRETLSPRSIPQALNHLPPGICFADNLGNIVLINYEMTDLFTPLIGSCPQTLTDIRKFLEQTDNETGVCQLTEAPELYKFPDGTVRQFQICRLKDSELSGFTRITMQDVTEIYKTNRLLLSENEKLSETNRKLSLLYDRLAERIREQETLNLKMKIHNDIGTSLITISQIMDEESSENMESQLRQLQNAVSFFSGRPPTLQHDWNSVCREAEKLQIQCVLDGFLPDDNFLCSLIADAVGECVTNCAKHAGGNHVFVHVKEHEKTCTVTITNDGALPKTDIAEGGGLSTLRKKIEQSGGEMTIAARPEFALTLTLKGEKHDKDNYSGR